SLELKRIKWIKKIKEQSVDYRNKIKSFLSFMANNRILYVNDIPAITAILESFLCMTAHCHLDI
ncbi:hypothetical protein Anas_09675, partial [Armadillidium nasatum]